MGRTGIPELELEMWLWKAVPAHHRCWRPQTSPQPTVELLRQEARPLNKACGIFSQGTWVKCKRRQEVVEMEEVGCLEVMNSRTTVFRRVKPKTSDWEPSSSTHKLNELG